MVKRWARYGHDRLYVQTSEGASLGYLDNRTGTCVVSDENSRAAFHAAIAAHLGAGGAGETSGPPAVPAQRAVRGKLPRVSGQPADVGAVTTPPTRAAPTWTDLSINPAGAAAREQAVALKQAAPVRTFFSRALGIKTDERNWRIGADAEEAVAARLTKLDDRWRVLHAVPVGKRGSDIDHVVIGPGGVFTVNTKHHPDATIWVGGNTLLVNGQRVQYMRNSRFEARRTAKLLAAALGGTAVPVVGVIVVVGARNGFTVKSQPPEGDVHVVTRRVVTRWLTKQPVRLDDVEVARIYAVARRSDTWRY